MTPWRGGEQEAGSGDTPRELGSDGGASAARSDGGVGRARLEVKARCGTCHGEAT